MVAMVLPPIWTSQLSLSGVSVMVTLPASPSLQEYDPVQAMHPPDCGAGSPEAGGWSQLDGGVSPLGGAGSIPDGAGSQETSGLVVDVPDPPHAIMTPSAGAATAARGRARRISEVV
jgi:hypothetical protein